MNHRSVLFALPSLFATLLPAARASAQDAPAPDSAGANDAGTASDSATASDKVGAETSAGAYVPPADPTMNEVHPGPTVPPCTLSHHPCSYPHLVLALDLGVSHLAEGGPFGFDTNVGSITKTGPVWGARVGMEFASWFALEAHYIGMSNRAVDRVSVGGSRGLLTNAAVAEFRFTLPTKFIQPYIFLGAGVYSTSITGSSASTQLESSTELGLPVGIGFGVPITPGISLGAEAVYHRLVGEAFAANDDIGGGDPVSANAVLRFRL